MASGSTRKIGLLVLLGAAALPARAQAPAPGPDAGQAQAEGDEPIPESSDLETKEAPGGVQTANVPTIDPKKAEEQIPGALEAAKDAPQDLEQQRHLGALCMAASRFD
jgi:hypothetical protein